MKTRQYKEPVERAGKIELDVDHEGEDLTFQFPFKGPGYFNEVKDKIRNNWLWAFTLARYLPESKRVYFEDISELTEDVIREILSGRPNLKESDLVKKLENTKGIRAVSFSDYKTGEQTPLELEKNEFVIAQAGEEGAEKLAEVADKFRLNPIRLNPILYALNLVSQSKTSVSALGSYWSLDRRLVVDGGRGGNGGGFALGYVVQKNIENKWKKK